MPAIHGGIEQKLVLKDVQGRTSLSWAGLGIQIDFLRELLSSLKDSSRNPLKQA